MSGKDYNFSKDGIPYHFHLGSITISLMKKLHTISFWEGSQFRQRETLIVPFSSKKAFTFFSVKDHNLAWERIPYLLLFSYEKDYNFFDEGIPYHFLQWRITIPSKMELHDIFWEGLFFLLKELQCSFSFHKEKMSIIIL